MINKKYIEDITKTWDISVQRSKNLLDTYNNILKLYNKSKLKGKLIDLGCADGGFVGAFNYYTGFSSRYSIGYDIDDVDLNYSQIPEYNECADVVTLNAVIEHIENIRNMMEEIYRVTKPQGYLCIRTPNWKLDSKNFYNDPTHVKPYTKESLKRLLELSGYKVIFCDVGIINPNGKYNWIYRLPEKIKPFVASKVHNGSKSLICIGVKE